MNSAINHLKSGLRVPPFAVALVLVTLGLALVIAFGQLNSAHATSHCTDGTVVPDPDNNADLVADCRTLLALMDDLRGTAELNWNEETAITSWDGITVRGTPQRVRRLELNRSSLDGTLPTELSSLTGLTTLELQNNELTGSIPHGA